MKHNCPAACADPESFVRWGPTLAGDEREDPNTTICGLSLACQRNTKNDASETPIMMFRWRAANGPSLVAL